MGTSKKVRVRKFLRAMPAKARKKADEALRKVGYRTSPAYMPTLSQQAEVWTRNPSRVLEFFELKVEENWNLEFDGFLDSLSKPVDKAWPIYFDLGEESARLFYLLIRATNPRVVLETGVANGVSTFFTLSAMDQNNCGVLHSIDMTRDVGHVFGKSHPRWKLHVTHGRAKDLAKVLQPLAPLDIFFHDADHSYRSQSHEYSVTLTHMRAGGYIVSDDVDSSWAFRDFCAKHRLPMVILQDSTKLFGVTRV